MRIANGIELVDFKPRAGVAITGQRNLILLRALPYEPIWPGFSINTIFYAAIVWMLFVFPLVLRRHVRRKRGQCAACGYSLRKNVSEKCPECGVAIGSVPRPFGSG